MATLGDKELLIIHCAKCGEDFQKEFGWLKERNSIRCPECDTNLWYYTKALLADVESIANARAKLVTYTRPPEE